MKALLYLLIAAAGCWILSELLEIAAGGRTDLTLGLTAAFHLLMAVGIWGAYLGQPGRPSTLSRIATGMTSIGLLVLVYPPIAVARAPGTALDEFMKAYVVYGLAGLLATAGFVLFGVAILRARAYSTWIGLVLVVAPPVFAATMLLGWPSSVAVTTNLVEATAFLALGVTALRR